jgi:anaerobic ribonucleoside-triphosphate reductase
MSNQIEMLRKTLEAAREASGHKQKTVEELIDEQLHRLRNIDILAELQSMDHFDEITRNLSKSEKEIFDARAEVIVEEHADILDAVADALKDPKAREAILEELKRRVG